MQLPIAEIGHPASNAAWKECSATHNRAEQGTRTDDNPRDHYGRILPESIRELPRSAFSRTLPEFPYRVSISQMTSVSDRQFPDQHFLQFYLVGLPLCGAAKSNRIARRSARVCVCTTSQATQGTGAGRLC